MKYYFLFLLLTFKVALSKGQPSQGGLQVQFKGKEGEIRDTSDLILKITIRNISKMELIVPDTLIEGYEGDKCTNITLSVRKLNKLGKYERHVFRRYTIGILDSIDCSIPTAALESRGKKIYYFDMLSLAGDIFPKGIYRIRTSVRIRNQNFTSKWFNVNLKKTLLNRNGQKFVESELKNWP